MNADRLKSIYSRVIDTFGEPATLRRPGEVTNVDISVSAIVRGVRPEELVGGIQQGDKRIILDNSEISGGLWPAPIVRGDKIIFRGKTYTIQSVDTLYAGDSPLRHNIIARG